MRIIFFIALVLYSNLANAFDDKAFCEELTQFKKAGEQDIGQMIDKYTRNDGMTLLCGNKIVEFKKFIVTESSAFREGWKERKAKQWNEIYCKELWLDAIKGRWTVAVQIITLDGERFWHKATCK